MSDRNEQREKQDDESLIHGVAEGGRIYELNRDKVLMSAVRILSRMLRELESNDFYNPDRGA
jgi:hypothetical protein